MNSTILYMQTVDTLIIILLPAVIVAAVIFFLYARKLASANIANRREEMHLLAMKINFSFSQDDEGGIAEFLDSEKSFFYGGEGNIENVIFGKKNGIDVALFDYIFSGLQKESMTVCLLTLPAKISTFKMIPLADADIESGKTVELGDKLLSDKYRLECEDKEFARTAFNEDLVEFLSRRRRTFVLGHGNSMLFHREKQLSTRTCFSLLDFAFGLYTKMGIEAAPIEEEMTTADSEKPLDIRADLYAD